MEKDERKSIGERLKKAREKCGLTQAAVCNELDIEKPQTISAYESGKNLPPLDKLSKMIELYKVSSDSIIFGESRARIEETSKEKMESFISAILEFGIDAKFTKIEDGFISPTNYEDGSQEYKLELTWTVSGNCDQYEDAKTIFIKQWAKYLELYKNKMISLDEYKMLCSKRIEDFGYRYDDEIADMISVALRECEINGIN